MYHLKFVRHGSGGTENICCARYEVSGEFGSVSIYVHPLGGDGGLLTYRVASQEAIACSPQVNADAFRACYVTSDSGKTIDRIVPRKMEWPKGIRAELRETA